MDLGRSRESVHEMQVESQGRVWKWRKWADCEERDFSSGLPLTGLSLEERGGGRRAMLVWQGLLFNGRG